MSGFFFKKFFFDFEKMIFLARISPNKQWNLISNRTRRHLMTFDDIWDQNEENLIFLILLFWGKNLKIGKFSFVDIFQKLWTFADISTCPSERGVFSLSFATKFEYLRRPCRSGEQIDQETIFEFTFPAGSQKKFSPQGLSYRMMALFSTVFPDWLIWFRDEF